MRITRQWIVVITPDDMGVKWPDTQLTFGTYIIRPDKMMVTITQVDDEPLRFSNPRIEGYRVLKSQATGNSRHDCTLWESDGIPAWVANAKAKAVGIVATEVAARG